MKIKIAYKDGTPDSQKLMRCETDGIIVTKKVLENGGCGGHRMRIVSYLTLTEWVQWKLGLLK